MNAHTMEPMMIPTLARVQGAHELAPLAMLYAALKATSRALPAHYPALLHGARAYQPADLPTSRVVLADAIRVQAEALASLVERYLRYGLDPGDVPP